MRARSRWERAFYWRGQKSLITGDLGKQGKIFTTGDTEEHGVNRAKSFLQGEFGGLSKLQFFAVLLAFGER